MSILTPPDIDDLAAYRRFVEKIDEVFVEMTGEIREPCPAAEPFIRRDADGEFVVPRQLERKHQMAVWICRCCDFEWEERVGDLMRAHEAHDVNCALAVLWEMLGPIVARPVLALPKPEIST